MVHDRLVGARWPVYLIVGWGVAWAAVPRLAEAAPVPPANLAGATTGLGDLGDPEAVRAALEEKIVRARLAALGVSSADADAVLARLSPEERSELATRADELDAGGSPAAVISIAIIVGLLVVLVLELIGRRVVSRP